MHVHHFLLATTLWSLATSQRVYNRGGGARKVNHVGTCTDGFGNSNSGASVSSNREKILASLSSKERPLEAPNRGAGTLETRTTGINARDDSGSVRMVRVGERQTGTQRRTESNECLTTQRLDEGDFCTMDCGCKSNKCEFKFINKWLIFAWVCT